MKKRAIALQLPIWAIRIVFIIGVLITMLVFINSHINAKVTIFSAEADTLILRTLHDEGIMQDDVSLQRMTPGIIDVVKCKKFSNDDFDRSISYSGAKKHIAGRFRVTDNSGEVCTATFNKKHFDFLEVQHKAGGAFFRDVDIQSIKLPVVLSDARTGFIELTILKEV